MGYFHCQNIYQDYKTGYVKIRCEIVDEPALASIMTHDHAKHLCASELGRTDGCESTKGSEYIMTKEQCKNTKK